MGSTEWAEEHREELTQKTVLYTNTDGNGRCFLRLGGSHALTRIRAEIQRDVDDPQTGSSLADRNRARIRASGDEEARKDPAERDLVLRALGSGSDYSAFFQHLGISSANIPAGGEAESGSYHTPYTHRALRTLRRPRSRLRRRAREDARSRHATHGERTAPALRLYRPRADHQGVTSVTSRTSRNSSTSGARRPLASTASSSRANTRRHSTPRRRCARRRCAKLCLTSTSRRSTTRWPGSTPRWPEPGYRRSWTPQRSTRSTRCSTRPNASCSARMVCRGDPGSDTKSTRQGATRATVRKRCHGSGRPSSSADTISSLPWPRWRPR